MLSIKGKLIEVVKNTSKKDATKEYYSANVYVNGRMLRVGIPPGLFVDLKPLEGEDVVIEDIKLWAKGEFSLYV